MQPNREISPDHSVTLTLWLFIGQEETGVDYEEGMRFTPFNMKDELEEGHFDTEGTYIFKKEVCIYWGRPLQDTLFP